MFGGGDGRVFQFGGDGRRVSILVVEATKGHSVMVVGVMNKFLVLVEVGFRVIFFFRCLVLAGAFVA